MTILALLALLLLLAALSGLVLALRSDELGHRPTPLSHPPYWPPRC